MKLDVPIIAILRGVDGDFFGDLMQASFFAGLQALEITMNTPNVLKIVRENRKKVPAGKLFGVGTVCCLEDAKKAVEAGAMFMVSPNIDEEVIKYGRSQNVPVVAGALTPTEVYKAWSLGASMVKVFPCAAMGGAAYIRDLRGPFDAIPMVAVGGVTLESLGDYFQAGAAAVGVGASFFGSEALAERDIKGLTKNVENYIKFCSEKVQPVTNR
jgi:2-dehydro-3-deoxyphosphogluconate aldolase/(4S)-4-hydroxy-2-oxoglutarate aldolase